MLSAQVIIEPAGTDWGTIIAACLGTVGTLAGVIIGSMTSRRAQTNAVKRKAYAGISPLSPRCSPISSNRPPPKSARRNCTLYGPLAMQPSWSAQPTSRTERAVCPQRWVNHRHSKVPTSMSFSET